MNLSSILRNEVELGRQGYNEGLPMGFDRLGSVVAEIQRGRYDVIGGDIGSGKTAFLDSCYLLNPYEYVRTHPDLGIEFKVLYISMEIGAVDKIAKLAAWKIWKDYGYVVDTNAILSKGRKNRISQEIYEKTMSVLNYFDVMQQNTLEFRDMSITPKKFYAILKSYSEDHGTWTKDQHGTQHWVANNPKAYHLIIIDHIGLVNSFPKKAAIDQISQYLVWFRNKCRFSPVVVSQYNRTLQSTDRIKTNTLEPRLSDFKETSSTQEDGNTVLALFSPYRYKIPTYYDYNIQHLKNRIRGLHVLKNRDGDEGAVIPLNFFGEIGHFREFPRVGQSGVTADVYKAAMNPNIQFNLISNGKISSSTGEVGYGQNLQFANPQP